jgi:type IV pilus assembly protein PilB
MAEIKKTGQLLIESGIITQQQLVDALDEQKRTGNKLGQILVERGFVSAAVLGKVLQDQLDIPYVHVDEGSIDPVALSMLSEEFIKVNRVLPYGLDGERLTVLTIAPLNPQALEEASLRSGKRLSVAITTELEFLQLLNGQFGLKQRSKQMEQQSAAAIAKRRNRVISVIPLVPGAEAPAIQFANSVISDAINASASDIHIDPQPGCYRVRYRIDGILHDITTIVQELADGVISRIKVTAGMDIAERRRPQDGHFSVRYQDLVFDFRIASVGSTFGEKLTIRILDKKNVTYTLDRLGMLAAQDSTYRRIIAKPYGIILVSGPTGSGKTTTLYATLNQLSNREYSIVTIEDPVEYDLEGAVQIQVNAQAGLTFESGLKSILRLDPNIIMVGEIRDLPTARIAVEAALTGHLVLASIHTNEASSVPIRLMELGIEPYLVASSLAGVVAQRLVRIICAGCKTPYAPVDADRKLFADAGLPDHDARLYRGTGCTSCGESGYMGRSGIFEVLDVTRSLRELIEQRPSTERIRDDAQRAGMMDMKTAGLIRAAEGVTTLEEVRRLVPAGD